jgi:hypothetical protein
MINDLLGHPEGRPLHESNQKKNSVLLVVLVVVPVKYIIASRRIMYLHNILTREDGELVKRIYKAQKENTSKGDFFELVRKDLDMIGEVFDEEAIILKNKTTFKAHIKIKINEAAFQELKTIQSTHTKVKEIIYEQFKIQPYMKSNIFTNRMVEVLFSLQSSMTRNLKSNFSSIFKGNMRCRLNCEDQEANDCQSHLLDCQTILENLSPEEQIGASRLKYNDIFGTLEQQGKIVPVVSRMLEVRKELLEKQGLPVDRSTGPDTVIANL